MQLHQLTTTHRVKSRKRVGRGGKRGTYSGHGGKGQSARSGRNLRPMIRDVLKRYPKLRGFKNRSVGFDASVVNLKTLAAKFKNGETITPKVLVEAMIVSRVSGKYPEIKILGTGNITGALTVKGCQVSKLAKEKIEKAGGSVKA